MKTPAAKTSFVAAHVREALTSPLTDLARGSKSAIEHTIAVAIDAAEDRWPEMAADRGLPATEIHRSCVDALESLARYACENRHSSTAVAIRDALAALLLGGDRAAALRGLQNLSDRQAADFVDVLDGLLVHRHGRIHDEDVRRAFERHGGAEFYAAVGNMARRAE